MRFHHLGYAALIAGLLGATSISTPPAPPPAQDPDGFVLDAGVHEVQDLIDRAAKFLGRNYIYSEQDLQNAPSSVLKLQNKLVLDAVGCEEVVGQLAYSAGFAMIPVDEERGIYEWVYRSGPKRQELSTRAVKMTADEVLRHRKRSIRVLTSLALNNIDAVGTQNMLRPFFLGGGGGGVGDALQFGVAGNSVLIQGFAARVADAIVLIREADNAAQPSQRDREWRQHIEARLGALEKARGQK